MRRVVVALAGLTCLGPVGPVSLAAAQTFGLLFSLSPDRSGATSLDGSTVGGAIYVFASPTGGVARVRFYLDDPQRAGPPRQTENVAPYDFAGTAGSGLANPFGTGALANGPHTITAAVELLAGGTQVASATFSVSNSGSGPPSGYQVLVSTSPDRSGAVPLEGYSAAGSIYVFASPTGGVARVRFYLDDPQRAGPPRQTENVAPYDFAGTAGSGLANPFGTGALANGPHTITAAIDLLSGGTSTASGTFMVPGSGSGPALVLSPAALALSGPSPTAQVSVNATSGTASFAVSDDATWLAVAPASGSTPATLVLTGDASGLPPGTYSATVTATAPGYAPDTTAVTLTVTGASPCSPLPCAGILVELPYTLEWDRDHGGIPDQAGVGTGFTYVDLPSNGTGYIASRLAVDIPAGILRVQTTRGLAFTTADSQDNALAVGIDAPSQVSVISTTLVNPPAGTGNFEQAGLWFGNDEDNYVKLVVLSTPGGTVVHALMEVNGVPSGPTFQTGALSLTSVTVRLVLRADPADRTVKATYEIDGGPASVLGTFVAPEAFFSFDAAGIDPEIGTRTFTGIFASHRNGPSPLTYAFGHFSVAADISRPPPGTITFARASFPVPAPTSMAWGPDGRLYVSELLGRIHAITLDADKQVLADEVITTLGVRMTLGITVDPESTPANVILWASHSSPSVSSGAANSGAVTRLSGPGLASRQDVITGLPRAIANHAVNSLHFGPDGKLYIAHGGNTGAGAPNTATTEFGTRPEQPLSAALLVADVKAPGFQGSCASPVDDATGTASTLVPPTCDVAVFASGIRNMYDFAFHSNGAIYGPDNGLGVQGTVPTAPVPDCQGTVPYSSALDPGPQPDMLLRLELGGYYGHPNPARDECVFGDGSFQGVPPPPSYTPGIFDLGEHRSANGTVEYVHDNACGKLRGELLVANYSSGDDITRIRLAADGRSVAAASSLVGGFNDPLPLALGPDGTIYVGEFGGDQVTALTPIEVGCWSGRAPLPQALLDAGGTALDGKLYVVAGKTAAGPQSTLYVYDPATDAWTTGPSLPGPAVENPAVVALGGKLYAFGGSTQPFSGAVANAAVYDPASSSWTPLAPMPTARGGPSAQALGGWIYVIGGMDGTGASVATVEAYDPSSNTWTSVTPMPTRRDNPGTAVLGGRLYVFGGRTRNADGTGPGGLTLVDMFDPPGAAWTARAPMPTGRRTVVVGTLNGRAQVMGGESAAGGKAHDDNEEYDPGTDSWRRLEPMPTGRHGAVAGTLDGVVYVVGGGPQAGSSFTGVNEAFAAGP